MLNTRMIVTRYGGAEVLKAVEEPLRRPGGGELRVRVEAAGVALADVLRREGLYPSSPATPFTPGYDAVGIVDEAGPDAGAFRPGDRVAVMFDGIGGYAAWIYVRASEAVRVPAGTDPAKAVAVILNYVTAYQMLHRVARVAEGERMLAHGAAGGVGTALLELGRLAKLRMYGTASAAKREAVAGLGATPIDYRREDFVETLARLAPDGMDAVFDPIGGDNWARSFRTLSPRGRFVGYGYSSVRDGGQPSDWTGGWAALAGSKRTPNGRPASLYSITGLRAERPDWFREDLGTLLDWLAAGRIDPLIAHRVPLREAAEAQRLLEHPQTAGKIVLTAFE